MGNILLNVKTHYQLLTSLIKTEDLINYALNHNITAVGVTDSNLFSFMEFYELCKKHNIKPIVGSHLSIEETSFILYAKNYEGYKNLCKIVSKKNLELLNYEIVDKYSGNLMCVLLSRNEADYRKLKSIFEEVYIAYESEKEKKEALILTDKVIFMNEVLCFSDRDYEYLKYLYMIRDNKTINDNVSYNIINKSIMLDVKEEDRLSNEQFIKNIDIVLPEFNFCLPKYIENSAKHLRDLCRTGLKKRLGGVLDEKYESRLSFELSVIENMGFVDYFLIVYDIVLFAKKNGILIGPGRGSAVGSLVSYTLGIIDIDPLKYNLLFERFLNPNRVSMPDIDIDVSDIKREKLIEYVKQKYGYDKVANIITFSTLLPNQVLRDVGKALDFSTNKMDEVIKLLKEKDNLSDLENNYKYKEMIKYNKEYIKLLEISKTLQGLKKHVSIHAAGIVIDSKELTEKVPLYKSADNILVGYDKKYIEKLGILKIDLLGIRNLSIIDEVLSVLKSRGINLNLNNISLDDKKTLKLFASADTIGIFQFETSGMRNLLRKMNVNSFNDLVIAIAMFRPGPMNMIPTYLKRREGKERITYPVKELEGVLKETLGIMVYQEQLLEVLNIMAGYTYAEADVIRGAIKSKNETVIIKEKSNFKERGLKLGYKEEDLENVYNMIIKFANYGFNKSHSVAYSMIAYQMGYLKANYPEVFMINLMNKEIGRESKTKEYIDEAKLLALEFSEIDINESSDVYYFKSGKIVLPLTIIKGIAQMAVVKIISEREVGKFSDFIDFCSRCYCQAVNKKVIESLILTGAFDKFGINKKTLIENLDEVINYASLCQELNKDFVAIPNINSVDEYEQSYLLEMENNLLGFYFSNHPVTQYRRDKSINTNNISLYFNKNIKIILLIESIKEIKTKNNEKMAFLKLSDESGKIEGVIFPSYYNEIYNKLKKMIVANISCKVEKRLNNYQLVINKIDTLK